MTVPEETRQALAVADACEGRWGDDLVVTASASEIAAVRLAAELRAARADNQRLEAQVTAMLAETTRWQREAQTPEERAWANVHAANLTRALSAVGEASSLAPS